MNLSGEKATFIENVVRNIELIRNSDTESLHENSFEGVFSDLEDAKRVIDFLIEFALIESDRNDGFYFLTSETYELIERGDLSSFLHKKIKRVYGDDTQSEAEEDQFYFEDSLLNSNETDAENEKRKRNDDYINMKTGTIAFFVLTVILGSFQFMFEKEDYESGSKKLIMNQELINELSNDDEVKRVDSSTFIQKPFDFKRIK